MTDPYDILVIGGGINGTGIARDAAGRGFRVLLAEQGDLAQHTSSASTKLIHGGLRYLEHFAFRLVRESLQEREVLLRSAPHIIWPMRFVLPHHSGLRPKWLLRLGLFLYDHLGGRTLLPPTRTVRLAGLRLKPALKTGFEYSDCWVDDARLVVLNAADARARGATIRTRSRVSALHRTADGKLWQAVVGDEIVTARTAVNAAGPWVSTLITGNAPQTDSQTASGQNPKKGRAAPEIRLVKGSHIVLNRILAGDRAFLFQGSDGRVIFAIPYEDRFTLVGTTDVATDRHDMPCSISAEETDYLLAMINDYFDTPATRGDIVWSYAGVRPLYGDSQAKASAVSRDYMLALDTASDRTASTGTEADHPGTSPGTRPAESLAPMLSVLGGKITTYRRLSEDAVDRLHPYLTTKPVQHWTHVACLPGGDPTWVHQDFDTIVRGYQGRWPAISPALIRRYVRAYGTRIDVLLDGVQTTADLGPQICPGLYAREVDYMVTHEFAGTAEDILWRRSKLGLHISDADREKLTHWLDCIEPG